MRFVTPINERYTMWRHAKVSQFLICVFMLAIAAQGAEVSTSVEASAPGEIVTVDVSLTLVGNEAPIIQFNTNITYDSNTFELLLDDSTDSNSDGFDDVFNRPVTADGSQLLNKGSTFPVQNITPFSDSEVQFAFADFGGNVSFQDGDSGVIARLVLRVKAGAAVGAHAITISAATDNKGNSYTKTGSNVTVQTAYIVQDKAVTIDEGSSAFTFQNVLSDASAAGTITAVTQPNAGEGNVTFNGPAETITYTLPDNDFNGVVNFTYTAEDGSTNEGVGNVTVTVRAINDKPQVTNPGAQQVPENAANGFEILPNLTITDVENDNPILTITGGNADGIFAIDNAGRLTVADNSNLDFETTQQYTLQITASDDGVGPAVADTVTNIVVNVVDVVDGGPAVLSSSIVGVPGDIVSVNITLQLTPSESPIIQFNTNVTFDSNKLELLMDDSTDGNSDGFDDISL